MVMGRGETADIHLAEESTSRQHLRFEMTPDGCQMDLLSARGVRVNGKTYKPPKKLLLDTGDVVFLGAATSILFVSAGDDPEKALADYRQAHPAPQRPAEKENKPAPEPPPAAPTAPKAPTAPGAKASKEEPAPKPGAALTPSAKEQARLAAASRARRRKFAILGGVYAVVLIGVFIAIQGMKKRTDALTGPPVMITDSDIVEFLREPIQRVTNENRAAEELHNAQATFDNRNFRPGNLQKCVKAFKLHLAYSKNKRDFEDAENTRLYQTAIDELIAEVKSVYHEAWLREKGRLWSDASKEWERLRVILPHDTDWNTKGYEALVENVMKHAAFCRQNIGQRRGP
jgi:hypothetical protein